MRGDGGTLGTAEAAPRARRLADALLVLAVGGALATLAGRIGNRSLDVAVTFPDHSPLSWVTDAASALLFAVPGWFLATRRPRVAFGWLALVAGLAHAVSGVAFEWVLRSTVGGSDLRGTEVAWWLTAWTSLVEVPALVAIFVLYPNGHLGRGRSRLVAAVALATATAGVLVAALDPTPEVVIGAGGALVNPLGLAAADGAADALPAFFATAMVAAGVLLVSRWRSSTGPARRLLGWMTAVAVPTTLLVPIAVVALPDAVGVTVAQASTLLVMATLVTASLRGRVYGIEVVLNRALVLTASTVCIAAVYGATSAAFAVAGVGRTGAPSVVAAVVAALALAPARDRVQVGVNRLLFGEAEDPFSVMARVAEQLESAGSADRLLPAFVDATASALDAPYVAVEVDVPGTSLTVSHGVVTAEVETVPLVHQGSTLGVLVVGRSDDQPLLAGGRDLLAGLARQASVAVAAVTLTERLTRSRARLLTAQDEERNRLRRDLHDGLGPQLTGIALGLEVVTGQVAAADWSTVPLLERLQAEVRIAIDDVRRLARDLRPAPLEAAGLGAALRALGVTAGRADLDVEVVVAAGLPTPEPRVEAAIYRIAAEALTNVVRHAGATRCTVSLTAEPTLELVVSDDGCGPPTDVPEGVGIPSMRARAAEVGGRWTIEPLEPIGCRVVATFPGATP